MKLKNEKGITLVALAITIIVLIILALITIDATIGENGLFKKAEQARDYMKNGVASDEQMLDDVLNQIESATATKWINTFSVGNDYSISISEDGKMYGYNSHSYVPEWKDYENIKVYEKVYEVPDIIQKDEEIYIVDYENNQNSTLNKLGIENEKIMYITNEIDEDGVYLLIFTSDGKIYKVNRNSIKNIEEIDIGTNNEKFIAVEAWYDADNDTKYIEIVTDTGSLYQYKTSETEKLVTKLTDKITQLSGENIIDIEIYGGGISVLTDLKEVFAINLGEEEYIENYFSFTNKINEDVEKISYSTFGYSLISKDGKAYVEVENEIICINDVIPILNDKKIKEMIAFAVKTQDGKVYNIMDDMNEIPEVRDIYYVTDSYLGTELCMETNTGIYFITEGQLKTVITNKPSFILEINKKINKITSRGIYGLDSDGKVFFITQEMSDIEYINIDEKIIDICCENYRGAVCISEKGNVYFIDDDTKEVQNLSNGEMKGITANKIGYFYGNYIIVDSNKKAHCYDTDLLKDDESIKLEKTLENVKIDLINIGYLVDEQGTIYSMNHDWYTGEYSIENLTAKNEHLENKKIVKIKDNLLLDEDGKVYVIGYIDLGMELGRVYYDNIECLSENSNLEIYGKKIVDMSTNGTTVFIDEDGNKYDYGIIQVYG